MEDIEHIRTSLRMTRVISDEIGSTLQEILQQIYNVFDSEAKEEDKIDFKPAQWHYLVTQLFNDEVLIMAINKVIIGSMERGINLNRNRTFLNYILEHVASELKTEIVKGQHPIADLSMKNRVGGKKRYGKTTREGDSLAW